MKLSDFDFSLPEHHIARFPAGRRDESKLMVVERKTGRIEHHQFADIRDQITGNDFLVVNNSRVIPARLFGELNGRRVDILISEWEARDTAAVLCRPAKLFKDGARIDFEPPLTARVLRPGPRGRRWLKFNADREAVNRQGYAPLPPYIKRKYSEAVQFRQFDLNRYQTVYAKTPGSIAAPTSGLHFSKELFSEIRKNCFVVEIRLDVGEATFQSIADEEIINHRMGIETIHIPFNIRSEIQDLKRTHRLLAVGTTSVRALETYAALGPETESFESDLFIYPGYRFKLVDKLLTNFHLPRSSLFILVSAFAGLDLMQHAYRVARENNYLFFSYGDSMLII